MPDREIFIEAVDGEVQKVEVEEKVGGSQDIYMSTPDGKPLLLGTASSIRIRRTVYEKEQ